MVSEHMFCKVSGLNALVCSCFPVFLQYVRFVVYALTALWFGLSLHVRAGVAFEGECGRDNIVEIGTSHVKVKYVTCLININSRIDYFHWFNFFLD